MFLFKYLTLLACTAAEIRGQLRLSPYEESNLPNSIISKFPKSLIHIVLQFSGAVFPANYANLSVPTTIYSMPLCLDKCSENRSRDSLELKQDRVLRQGTDAFRLNSALVFVLIVKNGDNLGAQFSRRLFQSSYLQFSSRSLEQIMPTYYTILWRLNTSVGTSIFIKAYNIYNAAFEGHAGRTLPAVFYIDLSRTANQNKSIIGAFHCWYCGPETRLRPFTGGDDDELGSNLLSTYTQAIGIVTDMPWMYTKFGLTRYPAKLQYCPMTLGKSVDCVLDKLDGLMSVIANSTNDSSMAVDVFELKKMWPTFSYELISTSASSAYPIDVILTAESTSFHFVTSDSVTLPSSSSTLGTLLLPFDSSLWLAICLSVLMLVICAAATSSTSFVEALLIHGFDFCLPMVDQFVAEGVKKSNMARAVGTMTTFWGFAVIVLWNSYKSIMKSKLRV